MNNFITIHILKKFRLVDLGSNYYTQINQLYLQERSWHRIWSETVVKEQTVQYLSPYNDQSYQLKGCHQHQGLPTITGRMYYSL